MTRSFTSELQRCLRAWVLRQDPSENAWMPNGSAEEMRLLLSEAMQACVCDPLTGLWNRRGLQSAWHHEETARILILCDVADFKQVNTKHGMAAGDSALVRLADSLRMEIRKGDWLVRWGGDEFVWVMRQADRESPLVCPDVDVLKQRIAGALKDVLPSGVHLGMCDNASGLSLEESVAYADQDLRQRRATQNQITV